MALSAAKKDEALPNVPLDIVCACMEKSNLASPSMQHLHYQPSVAEEALILPSLQQFPRVCISHNYTAQSRP